MKGRGAVKLKVIKTIMIVMVEMTVEPWRREMMNDDGRGAKDR